MKYFLVLFPFLALSCLGQSNYKAGFILKDNDTIKGYINVKEWNKNPRTIQFKKEQRTSLVSNFSARDISGFEIFRHYTYSRYTGKISMNAAELSSLPSTIDTSYVVDTVFLKVLISGPTASLLTYADGEKQRFFIKIKGHKAEELLNYQYNYLGRIRTFAPYKERLRSIVKDLEVSTLDLEEKIENCTYQKSSLNKIILAINSSKTPSTPVYKEKATNFFSSLSVNKAQLTFRGAHTLAGDKEVKSFLRPGFETGVEVYANPKIRKLVIRSSLSINLFETEENVRYEVSPGRIKRGIYSYRSVNTSFSPRVVYNFYNSGQAKINISGGVSFNIPFYLDNTFSSKFEESFYDQELTYPPTSESFRLTKFWVGFPIALGIQKNNLGLFIGYVNSPFGIGPQRQAYKIEIQSYSAGIRYIFEKRERRL